MSPADHVLDVRRTGMTPSDGGAPVHPVLAGDRVTALHTADGGLLCTVAMWGDRLGVRTIALYGPDGGPLAALHNPDRRGTSLTLADGWNRPHTRLDAGFLTDGRHLTLRPYGGGRGTGRVEVVTGLSLRSRGTVTTGAGTPEWVRWACGVYVLSYLGMAHRAA